MSQYKPIKSALISVYHKTPVIEKLVRKFAGEGVELISTGGTRQWIESLGHTCTAVEDMTGFPSIFGGRVKTLHPAVMGGILMRPDDAGDLEQAASLSIRPIDLVIVDLYPFADTVKSGASEAEIIEKIDIGGISLIRAAAKNFAHVAIAADFQQCERVMEMFEANGSCSTTIEQRRDLAAAAFGVSSDYDTTIHCWMAGGDTFALTAHGKRALRYGENPHQTGAFYGELDKQLEQLHGKEISYNNLLDIDAATGLMADIMAQVDADKPAFAVVKHNNACGAAVRPTALEAWKAALAGDPVSAFGGVIVTNTTVDADTAADIDKIFLEVIVAPGYTPEALEALKHKKNRIILLDKGIERGATTVRSALGGVLVQQRDNHCEIPDELKQVTGEPLQPKEIDDLLFANALVKHARSNAIVLARDGQLLGSGTGQTSRVDALRQAIDKARAMGHDLTGAAMASDAFFPFADCVEIAHEAGITSVIQPGGSVRDQETIDYCRDHGMKMALTGVRHFRH